ncbi:SigE family RNA polymerase sigma factor [Nocardioides speluncae]|uniref:SigE family RNA polymerase sigma factor n=1 Tax=Nocardioides speluncae TaxID=2670337 RepID=UPI000D69EF49|nr:SigE family RNA polymerase sigma factor [Nocardioides speluncae]
MEFTEYVAARRAALVRSAVLLGCPQPDAEDIVQSTLTKAYRSWRRVQRADQPDAYVYRILVNTLRDARARKWRREVPTHDLPELAEPDRDLAAGLAVRHALAALRPDHREVLVLRFFADLSEQQTADTLKIPAGTVKSRTARALATLSEQADIAALTTERGR